MARKRSVETATTARTEAVMAMFPRGLRRKYNGRLYFDHKAEEVSLNVITPKLINGSFANYPCETYAVTVTCKINEKM